MGMVHCRGCGQQIHESAASCPHCGAPQLSVQAGQAGQAASAPIPDGVRGWSWGAFLSNWLWAVFNGVWIGLLALVPVVNIAMVFVLGFKGREWAWRAKRWDSVEHFQRVQRRWSAWSLGLILVPLGLGLVGLVASTGMSGYQGYKARAQAAQQATEQPASIAMAPARPVPAQPVAGDASSSPANAAADTETAPASTPAVLRYTGTVDRMTVNAVIETSSGGSVRGYWEVTNRTQLAGNRYRLEGVRRGEMIALREFSETGVHEMDVQLRLDPATGELVGEARNLAPGSRPWAVRLASN